MLDLYERINDVTKNMFRKMLGLNELPDFLLERYFDIKKMLDKVDGRLNPIDLIRIALDCGFNPKTMRFGETRNPVERTEGTEEPEPKPEPIYVETESVISEDVPEPKEETSEPETESEQPESIEEDKEVISEGTRVSAFFEGDIIRGTVNSSKLVKEERIYSVNTGEEILDLSEDEIEVG